MIRNMPEICRIAHVEPVSGWNRFCRNTCLAIVFVFLCFSTACFKSREQVLADFYSWEGTELTSADPLIVGGDELVPLLIIKVKDPAMPKRTVVISYLCRYGYTEAIPVIRSIAENEAEHEAHRSVALYSLGYIEPNLANSLANSYAHRSDGLGNTARDLRLNAVIERPKRSYRAAFLSVLTNGGVEIEGD
jgi:hypothetical protein